MNSVDQEAKLPRREVAGTDLAAGLALLMFLLLYGGLLIGYAIANNPRPAPRLDARGRPMPDDYIEGIGYLVTFILLTFLFHLPVFTAFRWRLCRRWPLRVILPLQLAVVVLCLVASQVLGFLDPRIAFIVAPIVATALVYGLAVVVAGKSTA